MNDRVVLSGWGRTSPSVAKVVAATTDEQLAESVRSAGPRGVLARGLGRSYGDAAQNAGGVVLDLTARHDIGEVDTTTGEVTMDAGASLDAVMRRLVPQGWFVPVTPSTRATTVGGAIGSDIFGKDHHLRGTFSQHVTSLDLLTGRGEIRTLTPEDPLFWATVAGVGLTGVILRATVRMLPVETAFCSVDTRRCGNFDQLVEAMADDDDHQFSVAWVDCLAKGDSLGRSVLTRGRFATLDELPEKRRDEPLTFNPRAPISAPRGIPGLFNKYSASAFNEAWFRKAPTLREGEIQSFTAFFHPLDAVADWSRIYGSGGMIQYQVVVPADRVEALREVLAAFSEAGIAASFAQVKRFGPANPAPLSFPMEGWTLGLDIPATMSGLGDLLDRLDEVVLEAGGRTQVAKDSRLTPASVRAMYPRLGEWQELRAQADPDHVFQSDLGRRLRL